MNEAQMALVNEALAAYGMEKLAGLYYPPGHEAIVDGLWVVALSGAEARSGDPVEAQRQAAWAVAAALVVANYGAQALIEFHARAQTA